MRINERFPSVVVFSDVDDVLFNPHMPPFIVAGGILQQLPPDNVALVLCSGKTRAELEVIQQELGISHPFICEHGAAVLVPDGYFGFDVPGARDVAGYEAVEFGRAYADVVETLDRIAKRLRIEIIGFSDMSTLEVSRECHMPLLEARLAKWRDYEEVFRILEPSSNARNRLVNALDAAHLRCRRGYPFDYVGAPVDLSAGVTLLSRLYRRACGAIMTVGVTHAMADKNLLTLVDHPIIVPVSSARGSVEVIDWAQAIVGAFRELQRRPFPPLPIARSTR